MARRFLLVGVVLLGALLRLAFLDRLPPGLSHDEAYLGITALEVWLLGRREVFFQIFNGIEPLIVYWQALNLRLFGITPYAMRLVNVTAGLLTIPLTYAFTRRLFERQYPAIRDGHHTPAFSRGGLAVDIAILAALGVSISFWAVFVSRLALRAVTLPLLLLPAFYFLWRGLTWGWPVEQISSQSSAGESPACPDRERSGRPFPHDLLYFTLGGLFLGVAMYTYLSSRFLPLVPFLFFVYLLVRGQVRRRHWAGMFVFTLVWAAVFAPLALFYVHHPDVFSQRADQVLTLPAALAGDPVPLCKSILRTLGSFFGLAAPGSSRYGLAGRPVFGGLGAVFFLVGLMVAVNRLRRPARQAAPYAFLLVWWLVMLLPDFITSESPHYLRMLGALPVTYIFWALGIVCLGQWLVALFYRAGTTRPGGPILRRPGLWVSLGLALCVLVSGALAARAYFVDWAQDAEARAIYGAEFTELADYLETTQLDGPLAISSAYYRDWDRFRLDLQMHHHPPFCVWFDGPQTLLFPPAGSGANPHYVFTRSAPANPEWLDYLVLERQGTDMSVYRLEQTGAPRLQSTTDVTFGAPGDGQPIARVLGFRINEPAQAGRNLPILIHWEALSDLPGDPDYAFFVHLRDRWGNAWAQADANGYAVVDWQPGVEVYQWFELSLPPDLPPLEYTLWLGMEDRASAHPLPIVGQPGAADVRLDIIKPELASAPPDLEDFPIPNATQLEAGRFFTLRGYSLSPRFVRPGETSHVALYWQVNHAPDQDYTLSVSVVDEEGRATSILNQEPLYGVYPTSEWQTDQWVRDRLDLIFPPDLPGGLYRLYAGWSSPSGEMLAGPPGAPLGEVFLADRD